MNRIVTCLLCIAYYIITMVSKKTGGGGQKNWGGGREIWGGGRPPCPDVEPPLAEARTLEAEAARPGPSRPRPQNFGLEAEARPRGLTSL